MKLDIKPASDYPTTDLVQFLNQGFENYFVPIRFDIPQFLTMLRKDGIDLTASRVLLADGEPSGIALIARRGWTSRLAAMGIAQETRGKSAGTWFMEQLIQEARERNDREMVLEVIEQNEPAVRLYKRHGFQTIRRLIGLKNQDAKQDDEKSNLQEMDLREMGRLRRFDGSGDARVVVFGPPQRNGHSGAARFWLMTPLDVHSRTQRGAVIAGGRLHEDLSKHSTPQNHAVGAAIERHPACHA